MGLQDTYILQNMNLTVIHTQKHVKKETISFYLTKLNIVQFPVKRTVEKEMELIFLYHSDIDISAKS